MNAPSTQQVEFYTVLATEQGVEVEEFESREEYTAAINELRKQRPATDRQFGLASRLVRDHVPGKAVPQGMSEFDISALIQKLSNRKPTVAMLQRLVALEERAGISAGRQPFTTKALYEREMRANDRLGDELIGQLIDEKDSEQESWAKALVSADQNGAAETPDEVEPETEGSSVMTRKGRGSTA